MYSESRLRIQKPKDFSVRVNIEYLEMVRQDSMHSVYITLSPSLQ